MSDIDRIIIYMKEKGSITGKECSREIGTGELRRRIRDIKDQGYEIGDVWETGENRVGRPTRYKRYFILKEPESQKKTVFEHPKKQISFWDFFGGIYNLTIRRKKYKMKNRKGRK